MGHVGAGTLGSRRHTGSDSRVADDTGDKFSFWRVARMAKQINTTGLGLSGGLFLLFLGLKLCGVIDWSWWWITAPLWGSVILVIVAFAVMVICIWGQSK